MTIERLHAEMGLEEFQRWKRFEELYDLPDGYRVVGQLGALINNIMGGKAVPQDFAPYYRPDAPEKKAQPDLRAAMAFFAANVRPDGKRANRVPAK